MSSRNLILILATSGFASTFSGRAIEPMVGVIARDLGSTNGTYVEGHQVPAATLLDGNTITIGRTRILYGASSQDQD